MNKTIQRISALSLLFCSFIMFFTVGQAKTYSSSKKFNDGAFKNAGIDPGIILFTRSGDVWKINSDGTEVRITNTPYSEFAPNWSPDLRTIVYTRFDSSAVQQIYTMNADGTNIIRLTDTPTADRGARYSPDGTKIVFERCDPSPPYICDIWLMNADGSNQFNLTSTAEDEITPHWSPDGTKIIFSRLIENEEGMGKSEIFTINPDGTNLQRLTFTNQSSNTSISNFNAAYSPTGNKIVFEQNIVTFNPTVLTSDIILMNADGSNQVNLTNNNGSSISPIWSPDESQIAFASNRNGNYEIYTTNLTGTAIGQQTSNPASDVPSDWRANNVGTNNSRILFTRFDGNSDVYTINADGSDEVRITNTPYNESSPRWSPDLQKIVYSGNQDGANPQIYTMNADGTNVIRLTNSSASDFDPDWSPNGSKIVFQSCNTRCDIWVMNADGSNQTNLTQTSVENETSPRWSPDGTKIVFDKSDGAGNSTYVDIFTMNADGSNIQRLTNTQLPTSNFSPTYSPDGTKITFVRATGTLNSFEIAIMDSNGSNINLLTNNSVYDDNPIWSPDSMKIAFRSQRDGNDEIYTTNADGSGVVRLTNNTLSDVPSDWRNSAYSAPTPVGQNVTVQTPSGNAEITFSQVSSGGTTFFTPINSPSSAGTPPQNYTVLENEPAFDISTTASFTPPVTVCFVVSSINTEAEFAQIRILHGENGQLVDRTILAPDNPAPDFATRTVCARVTSLSPFVVARVAAPTAAFVSVSGRVLTTNGQGLMNALVALTDADGSIRYTRTSIGGNYRFTDVAAGRTTVIEVSSRRYYFAPQILTITEDLTAVDFFAQAERSPQRGKHFKP